MRPWSLLLTLVFLPALYVAWFRIEPVQPVSAPSGSDPDFHSKAREIIGRLKGLAAPSEPALHEL
jgi:hypothetical protein